MLQMPYYLTILDSVQSCFWCDENIQYIPIEVFYFPLFEAFLTTFPEFDKGAEQFVLTVLVGDGTQNNGIADENVLKTVLTNCVSSKCPLKSASIFFSISTASLAQVLSS